MILSINLHQLIAGTVPAYSYEIFISLFLDCIFPLVFHLFLYPYLFVLLFSEVTQGRANLARASCSVTNIFPSNIKERLIDTVFSRATYFTSYIEEFLNPEARVQLVKCTCQRR